MHINAGQCPAGRSRVRHKSGSGHAAQIVFSTQRARAGHRVHILTGIELAPRIVTAAQYEAEQAHIAPWLQRTMGLRIREAMPDGPLCPGAGSTPCMSYNSAYSRLVSLGRHLGITGVRTHMLRHQFASEALDASPRDLANISAARPAAIRRRPAAFSISSPASSCADPRCSIFREPRRDDHTTCTPVAPDFVLTVRTYGTRPLYGPPLVRNFNFH